MDRVADTGYRRQRHKSQGRARIKAAEREAAFDQIFPPDSIDQIVLPDEQDIRLVGARARNSRWVDGQPQQNGPAARMQPQNRAGLWIDSIRSVGRAVLSLWAMVMLAALLGPGAQEFLPGAADRFKLQPSKPSDVLPVDNSTNVYTNLGQGDTFLETSNLHMQELRFKVKWSHVANMSKFQSEVEAYGNLTNELKWHISLSPAKVSSNMNVASLTLGSNLALLNKEIRDESRILSRLLSWILPPAVSTLQALDAVNRDRLDNRLNIQIDQVQACIIDTDRLVTLHGHLSDHNQAKIAELEQQSRDDRSAVTKWWHRDLDKEHAQTLLRVLKDHAEFFEASRPPLNDMASTLIDLREQLLKIKQAVAEWPSTQLAPREALVVHRNALIRVLNMVRELQVRAVKIRQVWRMDLDFVSASNNRLLQIRDQGR